VSGYVGRVSLFRPGNRRPVHKAGPACIDVLRGLVSRKKVFVEPGLQAGLGKADLKVGLYVGRSLRVLE
jgi:hypothetical protein